MGMTYVELSVVLGIFAMMTSAVIFNYGEFQAKVEIKNLASDIALKIVEAQKSSLFGTLPPITQQQQIDSSWKPSYGIYFNSSADPDPNDGDIPFNRKFIYFTNLGTESEPQNNIYDGDSDCENECLEKITIVKGGNFISSINKCADEDPCFVEDNAIGSLSVSFKRPDSKAIFDDPDGFSMDGFDYIQITIASPQDVDAKIKIYPSGRIQVD